MQAQLEAFDREVFSTLSFERATTSPAIYWVGPDWISCTRTEAFQWLNQALAIQVGHYLQSLMGPDRCSRFTSKAWPVVCAREGTIEPHTHRNAQLSAVFYVRTEADNASGGSFSPGDLLQPWDAIPYADAAVAGGVFAPKQHRLLVFPSI